MKKPKKKCHTREPCAQVFLLKRPNRERPKERTRSKNSQKNLEKMRISKSTNQARVGREKDESAKNSYYFNRPTEFFKTHRQGSEFFGRPMLGAKKAKTGIRVSKRESPTNPLTTKLTPLKKVPLSKRMIHQNQQNKPEKNSPQFKIPYTGSKG